MGETECGEAMGTPEPQVSGWMTAWTQEENKCVGKLRSGVDMVNVKCLGMSRDLLDTRAATVLSLVPSWPLVCRPFFPTLHSHPDLVF